MYCTSFTHPATTTTTTTTTTITTTIIIDIIIIIFIIGIDIDIITAVALSSSSTPLGGCMAAKGWYASSGTYSFVLADIGWLYAVARGR